MDSSEFFQLLNTLAGGPFSPIKQKVTIHQSPQFTKNLFGELSEIAGKTFLLIERNDHGDCLIIVDGKYIVDVDHRDVVSVEF